ncbi:3'-5' exoribonuclease [Bacillus subtilis]|uniref:Exodeoxyribonuclease VIII n=2 Tax=Zhangjivirus TaxID=3044867 RepID=A0AAE9GDS1_9CAUD|nr:MULTISPECIES: 3'-5' exonuclease [Bacillus subtilis group]YP_010681775.1 exonuclease-like protein [Bacillus phage vB_BsuS_PJN02]YP_010740054.1 exodeoxyribonuclease VIII [Bacillus phage FADO]MCR4362079.1 3'-5' exoribonuclease [Bacillus subtilis]UNH58500.1 exonuclease-like protein [Bacillus phage vB_BsuS_PJN02]UNY48752.1 exodeoxyribonuclease VIII [Bacillus phage FADO]UQB84308.1 3'-5' exoribonuclease [Bacillus amyloliquefaciens]WOF32941.1 3'-5' exoribonuclease [Bacillus subtilis]
MERVDIMVDIETLGKKIDSTIIQIAAISFNIETGCQISEFNQIVDLSKNTERANIDADTISWWLKTNDKLFVKLLKEGTVSSDDLFVNFYNWIIKQGNKKDTYLWGNGILFDNKMIEYQLKNNHGISYPIYYKNDRDVRTILELASKKLRTSEMEIKNQISNMFGEREEHNALDDVRYQIRLVVECYKTLING